MDSAKTSSKEKNLRIKLWNKHNDVYRYDLNEFAIDLENHELINNLNSLIPLLDESEEFEKLLKAEIFRELGMFKDSRQLLKYSFTEGLLEFASFVKSLAEESNKQVMVWNYKENDQEFEERYSGIEHAVYQGDKEILKLLLSKGRTQNDIDSTLRTAVRLCDIEAVNILIDNGADVNAAAAILHADNNEIMSLLLNRDADINVMYGNGHNLLMCAIDLGKVDMVKTLINAGFRVNSLYDFGGNSALADAILCRNIEMVDLLIENGASKDMSTPTGSRALLKAVQEGKLELVEKFISMGASVNSVDSNGYTALMHVVKNGYYDMVKLLLENKADVTIKQRFGYTALHLAKKFGYTIIYDELKKHT